MAAISYSVSVGGVLETVVASTQAPSAGSVEIRIDQTTTSVTDGTGTRPPKKGEVQQLIRVLEEYLMRDQSIIE